MNKTKCMHIRSHYYKDINRLPGIVGHSYEDLHSEHNSSQLQSHNECVTMKMVWVHRFNNRHQFLMAKAPYKTM